jgi:glutamyl-tRNA reductase
MLGTANRRGLTCVKPVGNGAATMRLMNEAARKAELERALRLLRAGRDPLHVLETLSRRLTAKLLHAPTRVLTGHPEPVELR